MSHVAHLKKKKNGCPHLSTGGNISPEYKAMQNCVNIINNSNYKSKKIIQILLNVSFYIYKKIELAN